MATDWSKLTKAEVEAMVVATRKNVLATYDRGDRPHDSLLALLTEGEQELARRSAK